MTQSRLRVGLLGMPDNKNTENLLSFFRKQEDIAIDFVIYWQPGSKSNWQRFRRKMRAQGLWAAIQRSIVALKKTRSRAELAPKAGEYLVSSHNSQECQDILKREGVDVLLLATDAIIRTAVLRIPRIGTINAHPGWIPRYRGLGGLLYQMEAGYIPCISVHFVDEGVDTGAVLLRQEFEVDGRNGLDAIMESVCEHQRASMAKAVRILQSGNWSCEDTFTQRSNMTRGMKLSRARRLDRALRAGTVTLSRRVSDEFSVQ